MQLFTQGQWWSKSWEEIVDPNQILVTCGISTVLSNYTLFDTGCLNPFFKLHFYWDYKGSEKRINLINEISLPPSHSVHHSLQKSHVIDSSPHTLLYFCDSLFSSPLFSYLFFSPPFKFKSLNLSMHWPPRSDHRRCSGSSAEVCRNDTTRTTSSALGRPSRLRSCTAEHGIHRPCPHPRLLESSKWKMTFQQIK